MAKRFIPKTSIMSEVKNYLTIAIGLAFYAFAWNFFMAPYTFVTGGVTGICAIIQYTTGVPIQFSYFAINMVLILIAIWQLGLRFCLKTLYAITVLTLFLQLFQMLFAVYPNASDILGADKQLESCIVGSIFTGLGLAFCFISNGSSGGVDIIAAIVNKYKDVSFGRAMLYVDDDPCYGRAGNRSSFHLRAYGEYHSGSPICEKRGKAPCNHESGTCCDRLDETVFCGY